MRVLVIEDEDEAVSVLRAALAAVGSNAELLVAANRDEAISLLQDAAQHFDAIICDLRIPPNAGGSPDIDFGMQVYRTAVEELPGTPIRVLSAYGTYEIGGAVLRDAYRDDPFGDGVSMAMLGAYKKEEIPELAEEFARLEASCQSRDDLEIDAAMDDPELTVPERKALQTMARRQRGRVAHITLATGGLSETRVFRVAVADERGARQSTVMVKTGPREKIVNENSRYDQYVGSTLPAATFASKAGTVLAGAGRTAAIGYVVAEPAERLFDLLARDPGAAATAVMALRESLGQLVQGAPTEPLTILQIRAELASDDEVNGLRDAFPDLPWDEVESKLAHPRRAIVHGDLHGANVMVLDGRTPVLIDYGRAGVASATLDPLTLELSLAFHPLAEGARAGWPTVEQASSWDAVDTYVDDVAVAPFVRQCRAWALEVRGGERDVLATAYAFVVRQFRYGTTDRTLARAMLEAIMRRLAET